jgi:phosphoglycerol transferase MdoB-like AlkP superfamily enzyme
MMNEPAAVSQSISPLPLATLLTEWARDAVLIGVLIAALMTARAALIASLWAYAGPHADSTGVITALIRGIPFDCRTAVLSCLPTLVFSLSAWRWTMPRVRQRVRIILGTVMLTSILLLTIVDHFYFREYANQFDHFVIGLVYDDTSAILTTIWRQYPVVIATLGIVGFTALSAWSLSRLTRWWPLSPFWVGRRRMSMQILLVVVALAGIVCGARGSISRLPAQSKNVAVTADEKLLNRLVLNPIACIQVAINEFRMNQHGDIHQYLPDGDVRAAAKRLSGNQAELPDLDAYFARTAHGAAQPPRHIVVLLMESLSAWPLLDRYRTLGLAENLRRIATSGVSCERFLSEGSGTIYSLGPLLSGMPDCGLMQSYQAQTRTPLATALAPTFRRLGYRTRFFYSGYLSWQRLGAFVDNQGFEEINGGGVISDWTSGNEWGVDDVQLLNYVARQQTNSTPTLDVVLTTSNHPPYSVDVYSKGFALREMPAALRDVADDTADLRILGHTWFSDHALGAFVDSVAKNQPDTLFVITGDHYGRRFVNRSPDSFERTAVPCVFSGPAVAGRALTASAGSHLDLLPTLVELSAPAGFAYNAVGHDLFGTPQSSAVSRVGAISASAVLHWADTGDAPHVTPAQLAAWQRTLADRSAIGWWRIVKGSGL